MSTAASGPAVFYHSAFTPAGGKEFLKETNSCLGGSGIARMGHMKDYVISDPHIGHKLVSSLRGFDTPAQHDKFLLDAWIRALPANDHLRIWILGDNYVGGNHAQLHAFSWLQNFKDTMRLAKGTRVELHGLMGNHDSGHPMHSHAFRNLADYWRVYDSVQIAARWKTSVGDVLLSHFPYTGDHFDSDRVEQFRLRDLGLPLIHGHTHHKEMISYSSEGTLQVCVCVEACPDFAPVAKTDIEKIILEHRRPPR